MQVKSIAECSKGSILQYFRSFIKLPFVIMIFVLSIFEWPLKTGFVEIFFSYFSTIKSTQRTASLKQLFWAPTILSIKQTLEWVVSFWALAPCGHYCSNNCNRDPDFPGFILFWKQCRSRSAGFWWSHLIRIHTVLHSEWIPAYKWNNAQVNRVKIWGV